MPQNSSLSRRAALARGFHRAVGILVVAAAVVAVAAVAGAPASAWGQTADTLTINAVQRTMFAQAVVSSSPFANPPNYFASGSQSLSRNEMGPWDQTLTFSFSIPGTGIGAFATARHDTDVGSTIGGDISASFSSPHQGNQYHASAQAGASFFVTFTLSDPAAYTRSGSSGGLSDAATNQAIPFAPSGVLPAGRYHFGLPIVNPGSASGAITIDALNVVPEPSGVAAVGLSAVALLCPRRPRHPRRR